MVSVLQTNWQLISAIVTAIFIILSPMVRAQDVTIADLRKGWLKYEQRLSEQSLSGHFRREGGPADQNWKFQEGREELQVTFAQRDGHWIRAAELGSPPKSYIDARNPLYQFRVEGTSVADTVNNGWILKDMTPNFLSNREAKNKFLTEINPLLLDHRTSLLDLVELPYFELINIQPASAPNALGECLELIFKTPHPHVAGGVLIQSGKIVLSKQHMWLPIRFEVRQNIGTGEAAVQMDIIAELEYSTDKFSIAVPTLMQDRMTATRKGEPQSNMLRIRTIEWNSKTDTGVLKECWLSHYGLPEPPEIRPAKWNLGTWLLLVFGVAIVAMVVVYFWRRSKVP